MFEDFPIETSWSKFFSIEEIEKAKKTNGQEEIVHDGSSDSDSGDSDTSYIESRASSICPDEESFKIKFPKPMMPIYMQEEPNCLKDYLSSSDIGVCFTTFTYFNHPLSPKIINSTSFENFNNKTYRTRFFKPFMSASRSKTHFDKKNEIDSKKRSVSTSRNGALNLFVDGNRSIIGKIPNISEKNAKTIVRHLSRPRANRTLHYTKDTTNTIIPNFCVKSVKMPVRPVILKRSSNKQL